MVINTYLSFNPEVSIIVNAAITYITKFTMSGLKIMHGANTNRNPRNKNFLSSQFQPSNSPAKAIIKKNGAMVNALTVIFPTLIHPICPLIAPDIKKPAINNTMATIYIIFEYSFRAL